MRLRLSVCLLDAPLSAPNDAPDDARSAPGPSLAWTEHELEVEAPRGSSVVQLSDALARHFSRPGHGQIQVGGQTVPDNALLGVAPLVDGTSVTWGPSGPPPASPPRRPLPVSPVVIAVTHGPDAGRSIELSPGRHTVGRSPESDTLVADPALSRVHLELRCDEDGLHIRDLGSTNGTQLDGQTLGNTPVRWPPGAVVSAGDTQLVARSEARLPATAASHPDGIRMVNRRPRVIESPPHRTFVLPPTPQRPAAPRVPWVAIALPIPLAAAMAFVIGPAMLAFALLSPLAMLGNVLSDRIQRSRRYAAELAEHDGRTAAVLDDVNAACSQELAARRHDHPDPAEILDIATVPTGRLWERRRDDPDALAVTIGTCVSRSRLVTVRAATGVVRDDPMIVAGPCAIQLTEVGVLGICGERAVVLGAARSALGQLLSLHSPADLRVALLSAHSTGPDWQWLWRAPHLRLADGRSDSNVADLARDPGSASSVLDPLVRAIDVHRSRTSDHTSRLVGPRTLLVLDGAAELRGIPGLARVLADGPRAGISTLAIDATSGALPSESGALLDLSSPAAPTLHLPGHDHSELAVDLVGAWWAERLGRGLAPLRDSAPPQGDPGLPSRVGLHELLPSPVDPASVAQWWRSGPRTAVPLGVTASGPWVVDLAADGPHLLVAGTTGAGKSELLRTLVMTLALHSAPDDLAFVLVDYKGGAAFGDCGRLPHTAGLVTDLDDAGALRALTSLQAELTRRERILSSAGVADFDAYQRLSPAVPPLPRLVIVIDEFRALADELPSFVHGMVRIAALGRSLGLHLVLATQRPAGVVTADIKANVNLRIALRVRDRADSDEVVDAPDAASLDATTPGRGHARAGGARLTTFQAAQIAPPSQARGVRIRELRWGQSPGDWTSTGDHQRPRPSQDELARLVDVIVLASAEVGAVASPAAWLPPLPTLLPLTTSGLHHEDESCAIGLMDLPHRQAQPPLAVQVAGGGHWAFVGTSGSGRTTALLTMAYALAGQRGPTRVHLYAVSSGSLAALTELPHCGAHVAHDDLPRLERLVGRLESEVRARRQGSPWRAALALLIDDWDLLATRPASVDHAVLVDRILGVLREGAAQGLTAALSGDRSLLVGRVSSLVTHRVVLRLADRTDAALAGIAPTALPIDPPPGRGVLPDGTPVQVALWAGGSLATTPRPGEDLPARVDPLPTTVILDDLESDGHPSNVTVGRGGDELETVRLRPSTDGRRWLVVGASGSGVSTTLLLVARQLVAQAQPVAVVARQAGPLDALRHDGRLLAWCDNDPRQLLQEARRSGGLAVLVDRADELVDSPIEAAVRDVGRTLDQRGGLLMIGANSATLSTQYRGLGIEIARDRCGIVLGPRTSSDGDAFGLRLRIEPHAPPGRGYLVRRGIPIPVQVAYPGMPDDTQPGVRPLPEVPP